jgi:hypothetical protein
VSGFGTTAGTGPLGACDGLACGDIDQRRADVLAHPVLNGIGFVEVDPADHHRVRVHFLKPVPPDGYGIVAQPGLAEISGGVRTTGIQVVAAAVAAADTLELTTDRVGDFSTYTLTLRHPDLDPPMSTVPLSFVANCPTDVDCKVDPACPPETFDEPLIDYLAKDYASFRRLLLDFAAARHPGFTDANAADLSLTLLETLAYTGDQLSYFQDAVATEAYLDTARLRRSVRRHARLVDYRVHDGRNAYGWLAVETTDNGVIPAATPVLSRVVRPLTTGAAAPGPLVAADLLAPGQPERFEANPALAGVQVFETAHPLHCWSQNNEVQVHTWGNDDCVLAAGTREAWLFHVSANGVAFRPHLAEGDLVIFEEVRGTDPGGRGLPQDADTRRRVVVRIEGIPEETNDGLYARQLLADVDAVTGLRQWELQRWQAGATLPLLRVRWRRADALAFPLCLSRTTVDGRRLRSITIGRANVVAIDHGRTVQHAIEPLAPGHRPVELRLDRGPLTHQAPAADPRFDADGRMVAPRTELGAAPGDCGPAVSVLVTTIGGADRYRPVPDLLDSTPFDRHLVAEPGAALTAPGAQNGSGPPPSIDDGGVAAGSLVRFGDGVYGADPAGSAGPVQFLATYRVGNGPDGNLGADTLVHLALPDPPTAGIPTIVGVRNPLPTTGGLAPETLDAVRLAAPIAFTVDQQRAVTEADYAVAARLLDSVQDAVASFRWTGSWLTVFVGVDPTDPVDVVDLADGRSQLASGFEQQVRAHLTRYRQTGYDLELRAPTYVPLDLALLVCVATGHFRGEVEAAVRRALGPGYAEDGTPAFFHPSRWTFGRPVRLSSLYAAVEAVAGVDSVVVTRFRRLGQPDNGELDTGVLTLGAWEIARCDNDPNFQEHGVLTLTSQGGKG